MDIIFTEIKWATESNILPYVYVKKKKTKPAGNIVIFFPSNLLNRTVSYSCVYGSVVLEYKFG